LVAEVGSGDGLRGEAFVEVVDGAPVGGHEAADCALECGLVVAELLHGAVADGEDGVGDVVGVAGWGVADRGGVLLAEGAGAVYGRLWRL
jgi:hypothetical protein